MNFTKQEIESILMLIELKLDKLEEAKSLYLEFEDEIPEFIISDATNYSNLRNKIVEYLISLKYIR